MTSFSPETFVGTGGFTVQQPRIRNCTTHFSSLTGLQADFFYHLARPPSYSFARQALLRPPELPHHLRPLWANAKTAAPVHTRAHVTRGHVTDADREKNPTHWTAPQPQPNLARLQRLTSESLGLSAPWVLLNKLWCQKRNHQTCNRGDVLLKTFSTVWPRGRDAGKNSIPAVNNAHADPTIASPVPR